MTGIKMNAYQKPRIEIPMIIIQFELGKFKTYDGPIRIEHNTYPMNAKTN